MLGDVELYDIENASSRKVTVTERALRAYRRLFDDYLKSQAEAETSPRHRNDALSLYLDAVESEF